MSLAAVIVIYITFAGCFEGTRLEGRSEKMTIFNQTGDKILENVALK